MSEKVNVEEKVVNEEEVKIFVDDNKLNSCKLEFEGLMNCVNNNILDLSKCQDLAIKFDSCMNIH